MLLSPCISLDNGPMIPHHSQQRLTHIRKGCIRTICQVLRPCRNRAPPEKSTTVPTQVSNSYFSIRAKLCHKYAFIANLGQLELSIEHTRIHRHGVCGSLVPQKSFETCTKAITQSTTGPVITSHNPTHTCMKSLLTLHSNWTE